MNSIKPQIIDNHMRPIAPRRSSIKVARDPSCNETESQLDNSSRSSDLNRNYNDTDYKTSDPQSTKIRIGTLPASLVPQTKHVKLVISKNNIVSDYPSPNLSHQDSESYLTSLVDEYQASLNRKDCENPSCYRFKLLSYRISQTLFERINFLKNDSQVTNTNSKVSTPPLRRQTSFQPSQDIDDPLDESTDMDKDSLFSLVVEKNRRIQDLERLLDDQRRLRLQDASQVEEKASRIKEWVGNKLKELENQNRQLRDQNRKQKEAVESLSNKLATMSPISSPKRPKGSVDSIHYIDQTSSVEINVGNPSMTEKVKLDQSSQFSSFPLEDHNQNLCLKMNPPSDSPLSDRIVIKAGDKIKTVRHPISLHHSIEQSPTCNPSNRCGVDMQRASPVYDSVSTEDILRRATKIESSVDQSEDIPPPPPLHQSDKWELQLYDLVDQTLSSIIKQSEDEKFSDSNAHMESIESNASSDKDISISRKSSSSLRNDLISLVKPSFTTIDGDNVVDNSDMGLDNSVGKCPSEKLNHDDHSSFNNSSEQSSHSLQYVKTRNDSIDSYDNIEKPLTPNLFDSPMRSRSGKDSILRTQSVRRNPSPEKLYDFIVADLIKRGNLVKSGALKNYTRWFVLKNFTLYSYKCEAEETTKSTPNMKVKLDPSCQVQAINQSNETAFPFKLVHQDKTVHLTADSAKIRDEWVRILTVTINMSDIDYNTLTKSNVSHEGIMSITRHGHTKRYYAMLINHVLFFLKSLADPLPISYLSIKGAKIREITDTCDYDLEEQDTLKFKSNDIQDCSLAIYPKISLVLDPVYITLGSQQDTDKWFFMLAAVSGLDQCYGTLFERTLAAFMISNSISTKKNMPRPFFNSSNDSGCHWRTHSIMLYSDKPISQPLTSLPNETLRAEAIELFKSILLFTQVPLEPIAIDYHVCLLQNCLGRFLKYPELRNEFYAQLVKQCTYIHHRCNSSKSSNDGSECSLANQRESINSSSTSSSECQFLTDIQLLDPSIVINSAKSDLNLSQFDDLKDKNESPSRAPSRCNLLQAMQILSVAVSLNLPRGRMRWWLMDLLRKFANPHSDIGKYALYTLRAIDRTLANGFRDSTPSRMEIMSILLRNPHDHSKPHSLPVSFSDGSYLVVEADGSTTVDEFMRSMSKDIDIRDSLSSDFYLFADDPSGLKDLHILEPQRKVLDIVGWWEQTFRRHNSGHFQNTKVIKLICKKRLILKTEAGETRQERLLIVHQVNHEILSQKIPLSETLIIELTAIMAQLTFGDFDKSKDPKIVKCMLDRLSTCFLKRKSSQPANHQSVPGEMTGTQLVGRWKHLSGRSAQDCVRVYLNCIRRLKLDEN